MFLNDIFSLVEQKCDGRSLSSANKLLWAEIIRKEAAQTAVAGGFHGLYFLYKEAQVTGGSEAGEPSYELPDDFVSDLSVWYDGKPLAKAGASLLNVTAQADKEGGYLPTWFEMKGLSFDIVPTPADGGKAIQLFYCAFPEEITSTTNPLVFKDYFLEKWPMLHVYGMTEHALDSLGAYQAAGKMRERFQNEISRLAMNNRRFWIQGSRMRYQNWDEFDSQKTHLFPQFGNVFKQTEESA
jgi:hypothetical protein